MASLSVDGLVSGLDSAALIGQLLKAEATAQTRLKARLSATQVAASAYRTVNTAFAAVQAAGEALSGTGVAAARKATSSSPNVDASATGTATPGSRISFKVGQLASTQSRVSNGTWGSPTDLVTSSTSPSWPLEIRSADGTTVKGSVAVDDDDTLADAAEKINGAKMGVTASVIRISPTEHRLQITSTTSGGDGTFSVWGNGETETNGGTSFFQTAPGQNATLELGGGLTASSATNTFADLLPGVSVTVSGADTSTLVNVAVESDTDAVAAKMQFLVDAVNQTLSAVKTHTSNAPGSTAALKGESSLTSLNSRLLSAVSSAVGADGSPARIGLQLTRDGKVTFDKTTFAAALKETPDLAQRMISGTPAGDGVEAVPGIAARLLAVSKAASDTASGSIVALANGRDSAAKDIQKRIESWDVRLAQRKVTLTRQFAAMETALSGLRNQSTWLAGQINGLPKY